MVFFTGACANLFSKIETVQFLSISSESVANHRLTLIMCNAQNFSPQIRKTVAKQMPTTFFFFFMWKAWQKYSKKSNGNIEN